ncbi:MAG: hypothetical protein KKD39_08945 [Candidatus Altiarchaeota archaeon]|nr:hypothetical protein [Candidatus Altiarchaeota archaeon]
MAKKQKTKKKDVGEKDLTKLGKDLSQDNSSTMFDAEFAGLPHKIVHLERVSGESTLSKRLNLKCSSCESDFTQETQVKPIEVEVLCPECNEIHILKFVPSRVFAVNSETAEVKTPED